jgi:hypothetical protein
MVQGAVVEARVELAVPDLRKGGSGDLVAQLEVKERVALDRARQQVAETQRLRVGERADPHVCRHLPLERTGATLQVRRRPDHAERHRQQLRPLRS